MNASRLPALLAEIAEVAGLDAALKLAEARGGERVSIPAHLPAEGSHWLIDCVGRDAAERLCAHFRMGGFQAGKAKGSWEEKGSYLLIPKGPSSISCRARQIAIEALARGVSAGEAARESGLHVRAIYRLRAALHSQKRYP